MNKKLLDKITESNFVKIGDIIENFNYCSPSHIINDQDIMVTKITKHYIFLKKSNHENVANLNNLSFHEEQYCYIGLLNYLETIRISKRKFYQYLCYYKSDYKKMILREVSLKELII